MQQKTFSRRAIAVWQQESPSLQGGEDVKVKMADLDDNSDPERLELLPERQRMRLQAKYAQAWDILHGG